MDPDQVLAFRLARSGLAERGGDGLAVPASDFARDAALLALAARAEDVTRDSYDRAVDAGDVVVAHTLRGAIHALAPQDFALYGRALLAGDEDELATQIGQQLKRLGVPARAALDEVADAVTDALARGRKLDRTELHAQLRPRVREELMPWCKSCKSHHVIPMLWRYATVQAGARLDAQRRYRRGKPGRKPAPSEAARRFLSCYGPAKPGDFADWAGLAKPHARRLWDELDLEQVDSAWLLPEDVDALQSPPDVTGIRLLPPGDPYLQQPNRPLLAPNPELRKRLFRPVASPGAVLQDGRLAGLWKVRANELTVEPLTRLRRGDLEAEVRRVATARGSELHLVACG